MTPRRFVNYQVVKWQQARGHTKLWGSPLILTIEPTNACNLRCPHCFTGMGEQGREKSMVDMGFYQRVIDELGASLLHMELYNWGEPLLHKQLPEMIRIAADRGISTTISTNFSLRLDEAKAEEIVRSGLAVLGVSLDGATQGSYEQYRVRGNLETVLHNCRLINNVKRRLGSATPEMIWEYHIFSHNKHEIEDARKMAEELEMTFVPSKGWVSGPDWDTEGEFEFPTIDPGGRCNFLWQRAVIHNNGGVAPCCATFYEEDDMGAMREGHAIHASQLAHTPFRTVWNNQSFRDARAMFQNRDAASESAKKLVCYDCPITLFWGKGKSAGLASDADAVAEAVSENAGFQYFLNRRPQRPAAGKVPVSSDDLIPLIEPASNGHPATAKPIAPAGIRNDS
jgi:MoaA/NifB/PqqE/SkfB family radical SAM enzyme